MLSGLDSYLMIAVSIISLIVGLFLGKYLGRKEEKKA
jgi:hypothetical protein